MHNEILQAARDRQAEIVRLRRALHAIPELDNDLPETRAFVCARLDELVIPYRTIPGGSSVCAWVRGGPGRAVALRADMDALPVREETGLPYAAQNGCMHACGHDTHMAMLLGAASILQARRQTLRGSVTLLFQSGEEMSGGAQTMIDAGVLEEPHVDAVFGQHAGLLSAEQRGGTMGFLAGPFMASRDAVTVTVTGRGCHGAAPAGGVDPITVAAQLVTALHTLVTRECDGFEAAVLSFGSIHGGETRNIIPDRVTLEGTLRCLDGDVRARLMRRVPELARGLCAAMRAECDVTFTGPYPAVVNDPDATAFAADCARALLGPEAVQQLRRPLMISEDVSQFLLARPGCFWCFSTPPADGVRYPNHSPRFDVDESLLYRGAAMLAYTAARWLEAHGEAG